MAHRRSSALFAFVVAASACLPDLDASLRDDACVGGAPDGFLQDGEQCDDGNEDTGDGCAPSCRVECAGAVDPLTFHCFEPLVGQLSATEARDTCRTKSGAGLVTVRSERERDLVLGVMSAAGVARAHTVYELAAPATVDLATGPETFRFAVAAPSSLYRSPGVLLSTTPHALRCAGCFPADPTLAFTTPKDRLVLDPSGLAVASSSALAGAVCERVPAGAPPNLCPGVRCAPGAAVELELGGARYALFNDPATPDDAERTCASALSGHLLWLTSEEERERVVAWFAASTSSPTVWIGLGERDGRYEWSDGVPDGEGRPSVWTVDVAPSPGICGALVLQTGSFEVGLARPSSCSGPSALDDASAKRPFLCKSLDLNRR